MSISREDLEKIKNIKRSDSEISIGDYDLEGFEGALEVPDGFFGNLTKRAIHLSMGYSVSQKPTWSHESGLVKVSREEKSDSFTVNITAKPLEKGQPFFGVKEEYAFKLSLKERQGTKYRLFAAECQRAVLSGPKNMPIKDLSQGSVKVVDTNVEVKKNNKSGEYEISGNVKLKNVQTKFVKTFGTIKKIFGETSTVKLTGKLKKKSSESKSEPGKTSSPGQSHP